MKINTRTKQWGCLCSVRNAIFTALPYKHNGQAALKSTIKVKHCFACTCSISSLQRQIKEKARVCHHFHMYFLRKPCSFCCVCFGVFKMTFLQSIFAGYLVVLEPFLPI